MRHAVSFLVWALMFTNVVVAEAAPLKPVKTIRAAQGTYIDDSFAISHDSRVLAYVEVHEDGRAFLVLDGAKKKWEITKLTDDPASLWFMPNSLDLVMVWKKGKFMEACMFGPDGKVKATFKKVTDIVPSMRDGKPVIVTFTEEILRSGTRYTVSVYDPAKPKRPVVRKTITTNIKGRLMKPEEMEVGTFFNDYRNIYVKVIGKYDRKLDRKKPDVKGIYDVFTGTLTKKGVIARAALWDKEIAFFRNHRFYRPVLKLKGVPTVSGVQGTFALGLGMEDWKDVKPQGWNPGRFDFSTLTQQRRPIGGELYFSMIVDPQNPIILKQRKSEQRFAHFFGISLKDGSSQDLGEIPMPAGYPKWVTNGRMLAVMVLHDTWKVGAFELNIYRLR